MSDDTSKDDEIRRDDLPREGSPEHEETRGPLDAPQEEPREFAPSLEDSAAVRPALPIRHEIPNAGMEEQGAARYEMLEATGLETDRPPQPAVSILRKRLRKFKSMKRGYYSFILLVTLYVLSFFLFLFINSKAVVVHYNGSTYFPMFKHYPGTTFGQADVKGEADYRRLDDSIEAADDGNWIMMPFYPWDQYEPDFVMEGSHPSPPSSRHWLGTDDVGRDVFARLCYGFNISLSFGLILTLIEMLAGTILGGLMGYFGGRLDLYSQRVVEIWSNIPILYTVIIISSAVQPNFLILVVVLSIFGWIAISYYMRGEFLREKSKDYVAAAIALGASDLQIIFRHILPNALTPLIARLPFAVIAAIFALVSLDFLGFGLAPPTPSWGQMVHVGLQNVDDWWLVVAPVTAMFLTLLLISLIGEAIREAFDPKVFSRLR